MQNEPLVSIIIPIYNVEPFIERCLISTISQSYSNIEILCIDDCSPDSSIRIAEKLAEKDSRIKCFNYQENRGLGGARDYGISVANGEFVFFLDSDDYLDSDYVETYVNAVTDDIDIIIGGYVRNEPNVEKRNQPSNTPEGPWLFPSACTKAFRLKFLKENNLSFHGIRYYEDVIFNYRCLTAGASLKTIDYCGYHYVLNENSITRANNQVKKFETYIESHYAFYKEGKWKSLDSNQLDCLVYTFYQSLTIGLLVNIRHTKSKNARALLDARNKCLKETFGNYLKNPFVKAGGPSCEQNHIRNTLKLYHFAEKYHLVWPVIWLLSI